MSRTLFHRTNKEFDKCAQLLRNILTVQESRQDSKTPLVRKINRKKPPPPSSSTTSPAKKPSNKSNVNNTHDSIEGRLSYSPNKVSHPVIEEKSRKYPPPNKSPYRRDEYEDELVRSSSCGDLPSVKFDPMHQQRTRVIHDQFLKRIQNISQQLRMRYSNKFNFDPESLRLWNELDKSLSSALHHQQIPPSLKPLQDEMIELRKQLKTTSIHLHQSDLIRRKNDQYLHLQKKFDTNQIQSRQLFLHNEQLKTKCHLLEEKLEQVERNNVQLIQRFAQQDFRSISEQTGWISTENRFLLREEIISLRKNFYHVYDDLSTVLNRNQTLENSLREQKQQIQIHQQQMNELKQSAEEFLNDLNCRMTEEKMKRFLNSILLDTKPSTSSLLHPTQTSPIRIRIREKSPKLRPQSLFIIPNVLNDTNALSRLENHRTMNSSSSSTIDDADSTIVSFPSTPFLVQQRKRSMLHNSFPSLIRTGNYFNESGQELDQISDLTSKMFDSDDEEDLRKDLINFSTTSSSIISLSKDKFLQT